MTSKLHLSEPNLKTADTTGKNSLIITPGCSTSRARSAPSRTAPAFIPPMRLPSDFD